MVAGRKGQGNDPLPGPEQAFGVGATFNKLSGKLMTRNDGGQYVPWGARESILRLNSTLQIVQIAAADAGDFAGAALCPADSLDPPAGMVWVIIDADAPPSRLFGAITSLSSAPW